MPTMRGSIEVANETPHERKLREAREDIARMEAKQKEAAERRAREERSKRAEDVARYNKFREGR